MNTPEQLIVPMADGVQLVVSLHRDADITAAVWLGEYPVGQRIAFATIMGGAARIDTACPAPCLWLASTAFELPWLELLKVADFLQLDIPLPVPLGEQVPA